MSKKSRFYQPKRRAPRSKAFITGDALRLLIIKALHGRLASNFSVYVADDEYYLAPMDDVRDILRMSSVDKDAYIAETHDCDDFALLLKAAFIQAAYKSGRRRAPYALAEVWGTWDGPHAFNLVVTDDRCVWLIEPQTNEIRDVTAVKEVYYVRI